MLFRSLIDFITIFTGYLHLLRDNNTILLEINILRFIKCKVNIVEPLPRVSNKPLPRASNKPLPRASNNPLPRELKILDKNFIGL